MALVGAVLAPVDAPAQAAQQQTWLPRSSYTSTDTGDGSYSVPLLRSDVPDISVERVSAADNDEGRDIYYMISTTMHLSPGAPIMKSYDLVDWEIVNYVFGRASIGDSFSLRNGQNSYGQGQWASSLRYHDGMFYVAFNTNNLGGRTSTVPTISTMVPGGGPRSAAVCTTRRCSSTSTAPRTSSTDPVAPARCGSTPT
ncbi:family 43 glycosylhydrolase [Micromonospora sp. LOL_023]|uniref:family 43 glycosylhydrolase n=1 Tax=Micromonospora sp. LOL_023 TaxID=3345418 RepID=UPI003A860B19